MAGQPGTTFFGTPLVTDGILYSGGSDGSLHAFDAQTGDVLWSTGGFELIENATAVAGELIVAGGQNKSVKALTGAWHSTLVI